VALTNQQKKFVIEYLAHPNATKAAQRAGYSRRNAHNTGSELLKLPEIKQAVADGMAQFEVTPERVITELARLAFADIRDIGEVTEGGVIFIPTSELSPEDAASIKKIKSTTTRDEDGVERTTLEIEQYDKIRALELLGRRFKLFVDKVEMDTGADGFVVRLKGLPDKSRGTNSN
jgi:phage terminase small subunit